MIDSVVPAHERELAARLRASLGLASTTDDVDRLVAAVGQLVARGPAWTYARRDGRWVPTPDPRDLDPLGVGTGEGLPGCDR